MDLFCACDLRFCTQDARFCVKVGVARRCSLAGSLPCRQGLTGLVWLQEVDLSIVADMGTLQRLPRIVGDGEPRPRAHKGHGGMCQAQAGEELEMLPCSAPQAVSCCASSWHT